ncbi:hypothetical protein MMC08_000548 [Hypocenomyce scalaris]|nr:hypothetical protein [Hypocenomyce scalaris]
MSLSREELVNRKLASMKLSNRDNPLTAPPEPFSSTLSAAERAVKRFAIEGNAIVTGGAGNLALPACRALLEHGLSGLCIFDLNPSQSVSQISDLAADFPGAKLVIKRVDVTKEAEVRRAVAEAAVELSGIHVLCHFAGIPSVCPAEELSEREFRSTLDLNTTGSFLCAQACARQMISQATGGTILLIASMSAHIVNYPQPQMAYNVSKAGVLNLTRSLAAEWARYGIRVNSISPGYMDTVQTQGPGIQGAKDIWVSRNPMGRMGQPEELEGAIVLLCGRRSGSYMNGTDIILDGGQSLF